MPLASGRVLIYFVTLNSKSRSQWRSYWLTQQLLCRFRSYLRYWCPLGSTNTLRILVTLRSKSRSQRRSNQLTQQQVGRFSSYLEHWCPLVPANTLRILMTLRSRSQRPVPKHLTDFSLDLARNLRDSYEELARSCKLVTRKVRDLARNDFTFPKPRSFHRPRTNLARFF